MKTITFYKVTFLEFVLSNSPMTLSTTKSPVNCRSIDSMATFLKRNVFTVDLWYFLYYFMLCLVRILNLITRARGNEKFVTTPRSPPSLDQQSWGIVYCMPKTVLHIINRSGVNQMWIFKKKTQTTCWRLRF